MHVYTCTFSLWYALQHSKSLNYWNKRQFLHYNTGLHVQCPLPLKILIFLA
jgi:hypothetical protein